ncbi:MAG: RNA polymerase sigma factor [Acidobacteriota bacterium]|nr:RNA polymerase sigma factor [Acidobacteriota bacterium]
MRDDEEFTLVFNENYSGLCRFLEGMTGRRSVAQELAQECFLRLYRTRSDRAPGEEARFWLYRVGRNLALNEIKRRKGRLRLVEKVFDVFRPARASPEEQCEAEERAAIVRRMFNCLPEHQRAALLLREGEEMSYAEIACTLGISESKVKVDIFRARQALRAKWNEAMETPAALKDERLERGY